MNRSITLVALLAASSIGLSACADIGPKGAIGGLGGGAGGALACRNNIGTKGTRTNLLATIGCGLGGMLVGGAIGGSLDNADRSYELAQQNQAALGSIQQRQMQMGQQPQYYGGAPNNTYIYQQGPQVVYAQPQYYRPACRNVETTAVIGGVYRSVIAHACQQPDGSWQIVGY